MQTKAKLTSSLALNRSASPESQSLRRLTLIWGILAIGASIWGLSTPSLHSQTFDDLYKFCPKSGCKDGAHPEAGLVADPEGNLYGTTESGGAYNDGTVFEITTKGKEIVLHSFKGGKDDGAGPTNVTLLKDEEGNLYGATGAGGTFDYGTIFKIESYGRETILYSFKGAPDGWGPDGGLVLDSEGNLYGTTLAGGVVASECNDGTGGCGTVFKVSKSGEETVLYRFCSKPECMDGGAPQGGMVRDSAGNLYGTTSGGGAHARGALFKLEGDKETVLYSFCAEKNCSDGQVPFAGLVMDKGGDLYGVTGAGGAHNFGTLFKLTLKGKETVLHSFGGPPDDGVEPVGGLAMDEEGRLYGTTLAGGEHNFGTVFMVSSDGTSYKERLLHSFDFADGLQPIGTVMIDSHDDVYGTTFAGGDTTCGVLGCGTVFKIIP